MVELNSVVSTLNKSMDEALKACNFTIVYPDGIRKNGPPVKIEEDEKIIVFTSAEASIKFVITDNRCAFYCANTKASKAEDSDYVKQFESLLEIDSAECDLKDIKSLANEASFSILEFFKKNSKTSNSKKLKRKDKNNPASFEPESLAYRIANIYPELKCELDNNTEKYEITLPEEFFINHANKYIMESLKSMDKQKLKKLFNILNNFYEEGPKDTQSLIAVTILGLNFSNDSNDYLLDSVSDYMDTELMLAVEGIVKYVKSTNGKKAMKNLENPKPYKNTRFKKK